MKAIELNGLTKRFRERTAVDGLSFSIEQGELFSLLGQNGAGKTTTIRDAFRSAPSQLQATRSSWAKVLRRNRTQYAASSMFLRRRRLWRPN